MRTRRPYERSPFTWLMYLALGYFAYYQAALGTLMPFLREDLALSYTAGSLHFVSFSAGVVLAGATGDRVVARFGRRLVFWGSALLGSGGLLLLTGGDSLTITLLGCLVMGLAGAQLVMVIQAGLAEWYRELRAVAMTESNVAASACAILSPLCIGGAEGLGLGWRVGLLLAVVALAMLLLFGRRVTIPEPARDVEPRITVEKLSKALPLAFWAYGGVLFLGVAAEWCIVYWGATYLERVVGLQAVTAASAMSVFFLAMLVSRVAMSGLARYLPSTSLLAGAFALAMIAFPLFWLGGGAILSLTGLFLCGLGIANIYPLAVANATEAAHGQTDTAVARIALIGGGGTLVVPFLVGALADQLGLFTAYAIPAALLLLGLVGTILANRRARQAAPRPKQGAASTSDPRGLLLDSSIHSLPDRKDDR